MTGVARGACVACAIASAVAPRASAQGAAARPDVPDSAAASSLLRSICGADAARSGFGLLEGEVRDADTHPVGSAAVTIAWRRPADSLNAKAPAGATTDQPLLGTFTDSAGHWQACGAPLKAPLTIRAAADEGLDQQSVTLDAAHPVASFTMTLRSMDTGAGTTRTAPTSALIVFTVQDREGLALGGVALEVTPAKGAPRRVVTDSAGRAIIPAVEPGRARISTLAMGYRPGELYIPLDAGRNTVPMILDVASIPTLATVRVIGDRPVLARHQEFEMRRSLRQTTVSITAEEINRRNPVDTWQMLTNVPAMRVIQYGEGVAGVFAMSTREQPLVQRRGSPEGGGVSSACWYQVMLDGVLVRDPMPDLSTILPPPSDVHGIEVFAGLATIPPQYVRAIPDSRGNMNSNSCGLIAVWTK